LKRLTAIFFLFVLLFNVAGYRIWFYYASEQATAKLIASVEEEQFQQDDLLTLTVPLTLPYQTDWADWEKVRGEIEIDGVRYQYVQRKVVGGQMVLQCLPNKVHTKIESARDRFFNLANSFQGDDASKKAHSGTTVKFSKPALTDFDDSCIAWGIKAAQAQTATYFIPELSALLKLAISVPAQPPEWIA
jgi:lipopolysaccharide export system protein LptC